MYEVTGEVFEGLVVSHVTQVYVCTARRIFFRPDRGATRKQPFPNAIKVICTPRCRDARQIKATRVLKFSYLMSCHETAEITEHKAFKGIESV